MQEEKENTTKYGEFVCSNEKWLSLDRQKEQAIRLANITKKKNNTKEQKGTL